ncbi:hypothetical protein ACFXHB_44280, partial [Kitasatospora sp. NPDC059327]
MLTATAALVAGVFLTGNAASATTPQPAVAAQARDAGLTGSVAARLQHKVDAELAADPGARQVSANDEPLTVGRHPPRGGAGHRPAGRGARPGVRGAGWGAQVGAQ